MTADETHGAMPAWQWDDKAGVLRPCCPKCHERLMMSGSRLTCLIVGHSHYHEPAEQVVEAAVRLLARATTEAGS